jgi:hypothetical protein
MREEIHGIDAHAQLQNVNELIKHQRKCAGYMKMSSFYLNCMNKFTSTLISELYFQPLIMCETWSVKGTKKHFQSAV